MNAFRNSRDAVAFASSSATAMGQILRLGKGRSGLDSSLVTMIAANAFVDAKSCRKW